MPGGSVFNNCIENTDNISTFNTTSVRFLAKNGFYYLTGSEVNTVGQVTVPVLVADSFYTDQQLQNELTRITTAFPNAIVMGVPTSVYNCHSYAWYDSTIWNPYWIDQVGTFVVDIHTIRVPAEEVRPGDIIIYFDPNSVIQHSAIVSEINEGEITCQSKWGASILCEHAIDYVPSNYWKANAGYYCFAYRITPHNYECTSHGNGTNTKTCTICSHSVQENGNVSYPYIGDSKHNAYCTECDYGISGLDCSYSYEANVNGTHKKTCALSDHYQATEACTYQFTSNGNGRHTATCRLCGGSYEASCEMTYEYWMYNQHKGECNLCGYETGENCSPVATYCGNGSTNDIHSLACRDCGNAMSSATESCTLEYVFAGTVNGTNTHSRVCTECDYVKTASASCVYRLGDYCFFCGTHRDTQQTASLDDPNTKE